MVKVSGIVPTILYNEIEGNEDLVAKGSDLDIKAAKGGRVTSLSAIAVGNGKWEIYEMDDAANLFLEYDEGDILSLDVLKKILNQGIDLNQSRQIFSFNLLGKIKYGLKDVGDAVDEKAGKIQRGLGKIKNWFTDELDKETAENYLRQYYPGANVGEVAMTLNQDGKYWKVLFGVPSEKKFYVLTLYKNGNDIRTLDDDDYPDTPILSYTDGNEAQKAFDKYPFIPGTEGEEGEGNFEFTEENVSQSGAGEEGANLLDFEAIEDDAYKFEGKPTAVAIYSKLDGGNGYIYVCGLYEDGGNIYIVNERNFTNVFPADEDLDPKWKNKYLIDALQKAIEKYKEFGGKKDLSYLLQGNSQQAEEEAPTSGTTEDGIEWEISASMKRRKSKYNGKNVTGYDEGMFEIAEAPAVASSKKTFSKIFFTPLFSTLEEFVEYINSDRKIPFDENVQNVIKMLVGKLTRIPLETRKRITKNSKNELVLNFNDVGTDHYTATIRFFNDNVSIICPAYSTLKQEDLLKMIAQTLDSLAAK